MDDKLKLTEGSTDEELKLPADRNYWQIAFAAIAILGTFGIMVYFFVFAMPRSGAVRAIVTPDEPIVIGIAAPESMVIVRCPPKIDRLSENERAVTAATYRLQIPSGGGGSGFLVAPDTVVTAAHVVSDGNDDKVLVYCVRRDDGLVGSVEGVVLDVDLERDVALLTVTGCSDVEPVTLADSAPGPNEMLNAFGYSNAEGVGVGVVDADHMTCSFIPGADLAAGVRSAGGRDSWSAMVSPNLAGITGVVKRGNSGGPVFRRRDGSVVGLISAHEPYMVRSFMAPATSIQEILDRNGR